MQNRKQNTKGFTLVELVVVATILAILGAVGFTGYIGYIDGARDTNRITQLENIRSGLQTLSVQATLPLPSDNVTVNNGVEILGYQGYAGEKIINAIGLQKGGKDPLDDSYFTYYLNKSRSAFQLLGFLEDTGNIGVTHNIVSNIYASDYADRYPTVTGEGLGIIVGTGDKLNIPIQELDEVINTYNGILDISSTTEVYTAIIKDDYSITGDSSELGVVALLANSKGYIGTSCKDIVDGNAGLKGKDGKYLISPNGTDKIEVECDMTEDGGGWTLYSAKAIYGYSNSSLLENAVLKEHLNFGEFMGIFTSPQGTIASYRYKFFNEEEGKRAFSIGTGTSYDNTLWGQDASIHYNSPGELASAVDVTYHDTTGTTTNELRGYISGDTENYFSGWVRSSNNQVGLGMMTYGVFYHADIRNNYLWFPQTRYNGTWRVGSDTFEGDNTWTDGRSVSIWLR